MGRHARELPERALGSTMTRGLAFSTGLAGELMAAWEGVPTFRGDRACNPDYGWAKTRPKRCCGESLKSL